MGHRFCGGGGVGSALPMSTLDLIKLDWRWGTDGSGDFAGVDLVGYAWGRVVLVEGVDAVADGGVGFGHALSGAEVVDPGFHEEGFVEVGGVVGVAVDAPADGAVAKADALKLVDGLGEDDVDLEGDAVLDGDADWTFVGVGWAVEVDADELGCGALELVRGEVGGGALKDFVAMDDGQGDEEAYAGGGEGDGGAGVLGYEAPGDGAEGHAALEGHEVGAEGAGGDPGGNGELDRGVDAGHGAGPG